MNTKTFRNASRELAEMFRVEAADSLVVRRIESEARARVCCSFEYLSQLAEAEERERYSLRRQQVRYF